MARAEEQAKTILQVLEDQTRVMNEQTRILQAQAGIDSSRVNDQQDVSNVLKDQLKRAASSISLNIAEAYGRTEDKDRKRFFSIARGSAMECAAISDLIVTLEPGLNNKVLYSKKKLLSIVKILSSVILK